MSRMPGWILMSFLAIVVVTDQSAAEHFTWRRRLGGSPYAVGINPLNPNSVYAQSGANIVVSYDRGVTWTVLGSPGVIMVRQILVHPADTNVILCAAFSGGIQRSSDYGTTWSTVLANYGIDGESITYDPYHPDTMFAGNFSNAQIFRSTDRGLHWDSVGFAGDDDICALAIRPDSANILLGGTGGGTISKSTDGGATWYVVKPGGSEEIPRIVVSKINPMTLYTTGYAGSDSARGIWKSTDGGEHWFRTTLHASVWAVDIDYTNPDIVYAGTFGLNNYAAVFRSTDGGVVWDTLASGFPRDGDAWCLKVHPSDPSKVWLALAEFQFGGIFRWLGTNTYIQGAVFDTETGDTIRNGSLRLLQTGDTVNLTLHNGRFGVGYFEGDTSLAATLRVLSYPYYVHNEPISFVPDSTLTHNISLVELRRGSLGGTVRDSIFQQPVDARLTLVCSTLNGVITFSDSTNAAGAFSFENLYVSHEPIVQYTKIAVEPRFPFGPESLGSFVLDTIGTITAVVVDTADVLLAGPAGAGSLPDIFSSSLSNLGVSVYYWDPQRSGPAPLSQAGLLKKRSVLYSTGELDSPLTSGELDSLSTCIERGVNLFVSGKNFVERNDSSAFLLDRAHVVFAANGAGSLCVGASNDLLDNLVFNLTASYPRDSMYSTSIDARPVLRYSQFRPMGTAAVRVAGNPGDGKLMLFGFPFEAITLQSVQDTVLRRIIGYFDGSITVGVDEPATGELFEFKLEPNYPNPFNPATTIEFQIAKPEFVTIKIFDVLGREVRTLLQERKDAGRYNVSFNSRGLPSGIYFYRLVAGNFTSSRKMMLLK